jgi:glycosyltransferase involved in cell wall biosynthesis
MEMKKRILFVIDSLACAGAEKSLLTLLSILDYNRFEVDLQLFKYGCMLEQFIPQQVNVLPPFEYSNFLDRSIAQQFLSFDLKKIFSRWNYSIQLRCNRNAVHADKARYYWGACKNVLPKHPQKYDIAVAYGQDLPTFYVADNVDAHVKFAWVNCIFNLSETNIKYQSHFYEKVDRIVSVSDAAYEKMKESFPEFTHKMQIIRDMINADFIQQMAALEVNTGIDKSIPSLLTVARLNKPQKGYDIALEACKILKDRGVSFKWYAIGEGAYKTEMQEYINRHNLHDVFVFLGTTPNPYPYYKECTLYVQTSRYEGFGLSIAEARILNRPVVTTEFPAVYFQMVPNKNGIVVPQNPKDVADAIESLLHNKKLYADIETYLKQEKKGNVEELEKFYEMVDRID